LAQAREFLSGPAATTLPVVLVCDCNSPADGSLTGTYGTLITAGFDDAWEVAFPGDPPDVLPRRVAARGSALVQCPP
jgi:hypothetical protein